MQLPRVMPLKHGGRRRQGAGNHSSPDWIGSYPKRVKIMTPDEKEEYANIVVHAAAAPREVKETQWFKNHMRKLFDFDPELKP